MPTAYTLPTAFVGQRSFSIRTNHFSDRKSVRLRIWPKCRSTRSRSRAKISEPSHLQLMAARVRLVRATTMNPDKLFDYLDGKLPAEERAALEERFMSEPELRNELAVARQIHAQMGVGD